MILFLYCTIFFQWLCGWIIRANTFVVLLSSNITFIRHVMKYFEWREYIGVVWWLKYFSNKEENTIENMIKFHQALNFPLHISFFVPRVESYTFMVIQKLLKYTFSLINKKDFMKKLFVFWTKSRIHERLFSEQNNIK